MNFKRLPAENIKQRAVIEQIVGAPKLSRYEIKNVNLRAANETSDATFYSAAEAVEFMRQECESDACFRLFVIKSLLVQFENELYESKTIVSPAQLFAAELEEWEATTNRQLLAQIVDRVASEKNFDLPGAAISASFAAPVAAHL